MNPNVHNKRKPSKKTIKHRNQSIKQMFHGNVIDILHYRGQPIFKLKDDTYFIMMQNDIAIYETFKCETVDKCKIIIDELY